MLRIMKGKQAPGPETSACLCREITERGGFPLQATSLKAEPAYQDGT